VTLVDKVRHSTLSKIDEVWEGDKKEDLSEAPFDESCMRNQTTVCDI
jgi:hypothetical protein